MKTILLILALLTPPQHRTYLTPLHGTHCLQSPQAQLLADLLTHDPNQQRPTMRCNPELVLAAQYRAQSMATLGYVAHCDPQGRCPNAYAEMFGCQLPANYVSNGNNIESLIVGPNDAVVAYWLITHSFLHAQHLYGVGDFFREQTDYGIAVLHLQGSPFEYYYVFLIGRCTTP